MRWKRIITLVLLTIICGSALGQLTWTIAGRVWAQDGLKTVAAVHRILLDDYVRLPDDPARKRMERAMIDAMIDTLEDPHTFYVSPENQARFEKELRGRYGGIGAYVGIENDFLKVFSPMEDSPALQAGVRSGDIVLAIEGQSTFQVPVNDCIGRLTGPPGTMVQITVRHENGAEEEISMVRRRIHAPTVMGVRRNGGAWSYCVDEELGLAYIRVTGFNGTTMDELDLALEQASRDGLRGLILDLRDNPGGSLAAAVAMTDLFLREGDIVSVRPRSGQPTIYAARSRGTRDDFPLLVMVNDLSASASEIVAGALQDQGRAKILGTRSFGKGSVQEVRDLPDESGELKFTVAEYYLPHGRNLNRNRNADEAVWGVDPDPGLVIPMSDEQRTALGKARQKYDAILEDPDGFSPCINADWVRDELGDIQLVAALKALRSRVLTGDWSPLNNSDSTSVAFGVELTRALATRVRLNERLRELDEEIAEIHQLAVKAKQSSLLPADEDVRGGMVIVRDRQGAVLGRYRVRGGNLAAALDSVDLEEIKLEEIVEE